MVFEPGTHGSTFGGSPLASALATEALKVLVEENMCQRATLRGLQLSAGLKQLKADFPFIKQVRCRGLFSAIEMKSKFFNGKSVPPDEPRQGERRAVQGDARHDAAHHAA